MPTHYYPSDLAGALHQRWSAGAVPLPAPAVAVISVLYQASLLAEESRPVERHAVLAWLAQLEAQPVALTDFHQCPLPSLGPGTSRSCAA